METQVCKSIFTLLLHCFYTDFTLAIYNIKIQIKNINRDIFETKWLKKEKTKRYG